MHSDTSAGGHAVHSFDHGRVRAAHESAPAVPRGLLFEDSTAGWHDAHRATQAQTLWCHYRLIDAGLMAAAQQAGVEVIGWTVNDAAVAAHLTALGVAALCGDDIPLLAAAIGGQGTPPDQPADAGAGIPDPPDR